jgi:hypothetical protein
MAGIRPAGGLYLFLRAAAGLVKKVFSEAE